jgi:hypothetical protein
MRLVSAHGLAVRLKCRASSSAWMRASARRTSGFIAASLESSKGSDKLCDTGERYFSLETYFQSEHAERAP